MLAVFFVALLLTFDFFFSASASNFMIPTWTKPIGAALVAAIILPGPSIISHVLGLAAGYLMAMGYLKYMIEPSSKVVLLIESKIGFLINVIPDEIKYIKEVEAVEIRKNVANALASSSDIPLYEVAVSPTNSDMSANSK